MLQNLENCIPWCGWIFVHIPVSSGLYLGWTRPEEAGKVIVNSSFMSNEFMTWGSWKCSSNHRCNSKSIGFDGCHWRNPSKTCPVGWRYYTIYDLANKRIGLALARQPVGQAGNFLVKKNTRSVSKKEMAGPTRGIFTCQRGCSPSRIIVVRWGISKNGHNFESVEICRDWSGKMGIGWELLDCIKTTERPFDQSGAEFATSIGA